jgi:hypothetical protein
VPSSAAWAATAPTPDCADGVHCTVTYDYVGKTQHWVAPPGVTSATVNLVGAQGGATPDQVLGGAGARVVATVPVVPGTSYQIEVGGTPTSQTGGYFGGGDANTSNCNPSEFAAAGGGASQFATTSNSVELVAGGGGGGGGHAYGSAGGSGGGGGASNAVGGSGQDQSSHGGGQGGGPGISHTDGTGQGGAAGQGGVGQGSNPNGNSGQVGGLGVGGGGAGALSTDSPCDGGGGGGGGGGFYGGGGGGGGGNYLDKLVYTRGSGGGGGGGGSDFVPANASAVVVSDGVGMGNGRVTIAYTQQLAQVITFTSAPPAGVVVGNTYTPTATGGPSGQPVTFSVAGGCILTNGTVTFTHAGDCTITANQAGAPGYTAATPVSEVATTGPATQTVSFTSAPPAGVVVGNTYTPTAAGGPSGQPVTFSVAGGCILTNGTVTFTHTGDCTITANQAGTADYTAASAVSEVVTAGPATQMVSFTSRAPGGVVVGNTYTPTATGGPSGQPVTFSVAGGCTLTNGTVTFTHTGDCTITANQAGTPDYTAAAQVIQVATAGRASQTLTFTSTPPATAVAGVSYPVSASASTGLPVTLSAAGPCTMALPTAGTSTVTLLGPGSCTVTAYQSGNTDFDQAPPATQTFQLGAGPVSSDLAIVVTPGASTRAAGPLTLTVTVTNTGPLDSGFTRTQLATNLPVSDMGTATTGAGWFGFTLLTWTTPNIAAGRTATYSVVTNPGPGLPVFGASTQATTPDPNPFNNFTVGGYYIR